MSKHQGTKTIQQTFKKSYESNLYVKFIPNTVTSDQLLETFSQAGKIISSKLNTTQTSVQNESINLY